VGVIFRFVLLIITPDGNMHLCTHVHTEGQHNGMCVGYTPVMGKSQIKSQVQSTNHLRK